MTLVAPQFEEGALAVYDGHLVEVGHTRDRFRDDAEWIYATCKVVSDPEAGSLYTGDPFTAVPESELSEPTSMQFGLRAAIHEAIQRRTAAAERIDEAKKALDEAKKDWDTADGDIMALVKARMRLTAAGWAV